MDSISAQRIRFGAPLHSQLTPGLQWVEIASAFQIPAFHVVGLPSQEVAEARERVRAAIDASGFDFPRRRIVLNLSPASVRKQGTATDLAMALTVLAEGGGDSAPADRASVVEEVPTLRWIASGELGLDGTVKACGRVTRSVHAAWRAGAETLIVAQAELASARLAIALVRDAGGLPGAPPELAGVGSLRDAWELARSVMRETARTTPDQPARLPRLLRTARTTPDQPARLPRSATTGEGLPLPAVADSTASADSLMLLPRSLERAVSVAVAGGHHLLLLGPRGTGKSHALEWAQRLQPAPSKEILLERVLLSELVNPGAESSEPAAIQRVGQQASAAALIGSLQPGWVRPGAFTLSHGGMLLADELPEWNRDAREALREPLERGRVVLSRAKCTAELPARFSLAATGNLCPCGGWPPGLTLPSAYSGGRKPPRCRCRRSVRASYVARLSGPVLDRVDLALLVAAPPAASEESGPGAAAQRLTELRARIEATRRLLIASWNALPGALDGSRTEAILADRRRLTAHPALREAPSLRARHRIARLGLTLAAWDGVPEPADHHLTEAACYRTERLGLHA